MTDQVHLYIWDCWDCLAAVKVARHVCMRKNLNSVVSLCFGPRIRLFLHRVLSRFCLAMQLDAPCQSTRATWSIRSMKQLPSHDTEMTDAPFQSTITTWSFRSMKQPVPSHDTIHDHEMTPDPMICPWCQVQRPRREWTGTQWKQNSPVCFHYNCCKSCSPCNLMVRRCDITEATRSVLLD